MGEGESACGLGPLGLRVGFQGPSASRGENPTTTALDGRPEQGEELLREQGSRVGAASPITVSQANAAPTRNDASRGVSVLGRCLCGSVDAAFSAAEQVAFPADEQGPFHEEK